MNLFMLENWPLLLICVGMLACGVIDGLILKVPNKITFPLILSGWLLGLLHTCGLRIDGNGVETGIGGIGASLACSLEGFALLVLVYLLRAMGAGDVKMQTGFGAWVGAFFGWEVGKWVVFLSFCVGGLVGGVIAIGMMIVNRSYRKNIENMRLIMTDFLVAGSFTKMAERGHDIREKGPKLPYGIPLCIGFVSYLWYIYN